MSTDVYEFTTKMTIRKHDIVWRTTRMLQSFIILTRHLESGRALDLAEFVFHRDPVQACVVDRHVAYLQRPIVVVFADSHSAVDADRLAVLLPRRPRWWVTGNAALESDRVADVRDAVVKDGVKFRRAAPFQPLGRTSVVARFACEARDLINTQYNYYYYNYFIFIQW